MATIAEIRKKYPQYSDLSDRQLADSLRTKFYSDIPEDDFLNRVGLGETSVLRDVGGALVRGAGQIVSLPGQLAGLVTGDMDNISTRAGKAVEEFGEELQTEAFRELQRQQAARVEEAGKEGFLSGFGQQAKELLTDPLSLAAGIAQTAPAMIGTGGAGLAGRALAGRLIGQQAAKRGALAGAATGEAAIVGGDAAQATYDRVSQMPQEVVARSDAYQAAIAEGATPEAARNAAAISAARRAAAVAAPIAAATGPLGLEAALLTGGVRRGVLRGGAEGAIREGGTEIVQETGQGVAENIGAQAIDPNVALTEDLGGRAAAGLILGGTMGGGAGAISGLRGPEAEPAPEPGTEPPPAAGPEVEPEPEPETGVPATPFGAPPAPEPPPVRPAGETVTIEDDEVTIEYPDGRIETIPRADWDARQKAAATPVETPAAEPVAEPVVEPVAEPVAEPTVAEPAPTQGLRLVHGSTNPDLTIDDIVVEPRAGTKQGKGKAQFGGFYASSEERLSDAEGYAAMGSSPGAVFNVDLVPNAVISPYNKDITRISKEEIEEQRAAGVDVLTGKDPRGRTEYVIINKAAIQDFTRREPAPAPEIPVVTDELPSRLKEPQPQTQEQEAKAKKFNRGLASAIKGGNMGVVADYLAKKGTLPTTREFMGRARNLIRTFEQMGISNRITRYTPGKPRNALELAIKPNDLGANVNLPRVDTETFGLSDMNIAVRSTLGVSEQTVAHEILHAVTVPAIKYPERFPKGSGVRKAAEDLRALAKEVAKVLKSADPNKVPAKYAAMSDYLAKPEEILTWGLTDYEFQQFMKTIPMKSGNAFTNFVKYIGQLLGIKEGDYNALTRLIEISEVLIPSDVEGMADVARDFQTFKESPTIIDEAQPLSQAVSSQKQPPPQQPPPQQPPPTGPTSPPQQPPAPSPPITPTKETRGEAWSRKIVDRFERLRVVQNLGQLRAGIEGFYEAARKFDSRAGELMAKFNRDYFQPIEKIMKEAGLSLETVDAYLYARAAPDRNARLKAKAENEIRTKMYNKIISEMEADGATEAEIQTAIIDADADVQAAIAKAAADGKIPESGSGMTDQEAADIMNDFRGQDYFPALERIGEIFNRANKERMENNIQRGLVSREIGEQLLRDEPNYVPMKGFEFDENLNEPVEGFEDVMGYGGSGFGVSVREWYDTRGRTSIGFSPLSTFVSDVGTSIVRGERNRVGQKLMTFFIDNPSESWKVFSYRNPPRNRNGDIQRPSPFDPNFMVVKRGGDTFYLRIDDPLLAKAAKNLNPQQMNSLLQISSNLTRMLSRSFTTANPDFFVPNVFRDLQSAALNLGAEAPGLLKAFRKNVTNRDAFKTIAAFEYGRPIKNKAMGQRYEQFKLDGGSVSWVQRDTPQEHAAKIQNNLKTVNDSLRNLKDNRTAKNAIDVVWNPTSKGFRAMVGALESTNAIFENGIRFAAYNAALDVGMSRDQAAMIAREATVDFNRRGEAGALLNALYAFFNAGIQGSVRTARALSNNPLKTGKLSTTQAALLGMMTTAATLAAANAALSDEDDDGKLFWDKIPDYEKERNLIIMNPLDGKTYTKIPMPYGFGFFPYLATRTMDAARRGDDLGAVGLDIATAGLGNFSPVQFGAGNIPSSVARAVTPTMGKPFVELMLNENFMGKPIYNEPFDKGQSYASVARFNTPEGYKELSQFLNDISGGEGKLKGNLNAPAESFEYLTEFAFGGVTNLAKSLYRTGEEGDVVAAPVVRRLVGQPGKGRNVGEYYEREERARVVNQQMKDLTGLERRALIEKFPAETNPRVQSALTSARSAVRKLNEERKRIRNLDIDEGVKAERLEALRERTDAEFVRFNRIYNQVEQATR
jgi:hypothetical protein